MQIRLLSITLRNFKGCTSEKTYKFDGKDAYIYGDNAAGKTTIYDAFTWLLFDKNSLGVSDFEVKPKGMERPEVEVSAVISVDGKEIELKKQLTEQWTRKRGYDEESFTGHNTAFWVNGIPKKSGEYKAFIDSIVSEDTFKRLTNATFFLSMKKADMRKILLERTGKVKDEDIAGGDPEQQELVSFMQSNGYTIDDVLKLTKQNITTYTAEQTNISPRIDEVRRAMPESDIDYAEIENKIRIGTEYIEKVDIALSSSQNRMQEITEKQKQIFELQSKAEQYKRVEINRLNEQRNKDIELRSKLSSHAILLKGQIDNINQKIYNINDGLKSVAENQKELVAQYKLFAAQQKENAEKVFEPLSEDALICSQCGQMLPQDKIEEINNTAKELFLSKKAQVAEQCAARIAEITTSGRREKTRKTNFELQLADLMKEKESALAELQIAESQLKIVTGRIDSTLEAKDINLAGNPEYDAIISEIEDIRNSINLSDDKTPQYIENKRKVQEQVAELQKQLSQKGEIERLQARIEELTARGKELAGLIAQEKATQYQAERFNRKKAELLQENINSMFENLSFRLFETQINGGIVDDCTPLIHGVEYSNASNSERIRANLDIINAMQKSEGIYCPVFADNAEACTHFRKMNCQVLYLIVSEPDKTLRIELKGE